MKNKKTLEENKFKNRIISFNPETMTLLEDSIIITYDNTPFEDLNTAYRFHKDIQNYFNKKIIFDFNDIYLEVSEKTDRKTIIESYDYCDNIRFQTEINDNIERDIFELSKRVNSETKENIIEISKILNNLFIATKMFDCTIPIISFSNKRKIEKLTYKLFTKNTKYPSLTSSIDVPKVKIKR